MRNMIVATLLIGMLGCATNPLGMSDNEWKALTPGQKLEAREKQAVLDQANAERRAKERSERARRALDAKNAEEARLVAVVEKGGSGSILSCAIEGGLARFPFSKSWRPFEAVSFKIIRSQSLTVPVRMRATKSRINEKYFVGVTYSELANELLICPDGQIAINQRHCHHVPILPSDRRYGFVRKLNVVDQFKRSQLTCEDG